MSEPSFPEPFVGLAPFSKEQRHLFFGRSKESEIIVDNMLASRLTVLFGHSGVGKSSLLNAGVIPTLEERSVASDGRQLFQVRVMRAWRDDPVATVRSLIGASKDGPTDLTELLIGATSAGVELLVILDQFDEFFLYHGVDSKPDGFAGQFARAINHRALRVHWLISLREDALGALDGFKATIPKLLDNRLRLRRLDERGAREAIVGPLDWYNGHFRSVFPPARIDPALVSAVLRGVNAAGHPIAAASGKDAALRVEAPFLQLVMSRLWKAAIPTEAARPVELTEQTLTDLGGCGRILATHLETALQSMPAAQLDLAAAIFRHLVTPSGTKIALDVGDLAAYVKEPKDRILQVLERLANSENRIITPLASASGATRYQILHDVLAAPIKEWRLRHEAAREHEAETLKAQAAADAARREADREAALARKRRTQVRWLTALSAVSLLLLTFAAFMTWSYYRTLRQLQATQQQLVDTKAEILQFQRQLQARELEAANLFQRNDVTHARQDVLAEQALAPNANPVAAKAAAEEEQRLEAESDAARERAYQLVKQSVDQQRELAELEERMRRLAPASRPVAGSAPTSLPGTAVDVSAVRLTPAPATISASDVRFGVIGDSGTGLRAQYQVAEQLVASKPEFVLMLGDNIYGAQGPADYVRKFETPYRALLDADVKFYAVLGNHDDRTQRAYGRFNMGHQPYYSFERSGILFVGLDSNYLDLTQVNWLTRTLAESRHEWKICFLHHPLYSPAGRHGSNFTLQRLLEPVFIEYGVSVVLTAHDHVYARMKPQNGITYFVSGAAGQLRQADIDGKSLSWKRGSTPTTHS